MLAAAEQGTDRLTSLVTNLLDMNRLQTGAVKPPTGRPSSKRLQRAIGGLLLSAVVSEVGEDLPVVNTDPALLERNFRERH